MTITEFLEARFDEEEAVAQEAGVVHPDWGNPRRALYANSDTVHVGVPTERFAADVAARRAIVRRAQQAQERIENRNSQPPDSAAGHDVAFREVVRMLAQPYADHPDFREEWSLS
jgi:hypothetical protein